MTLDVAGIDQWLEYVLKEYAGQGPVSTIIPVAHGSGIALIRQDQLVCAPLDYEWVGVARDRVAYDRERDRFSDTGSPALPAGLNIGMQLHWLDSLGQERLWRLSAPALGSVLGMAAFIRGRRDYRR